MLEEVGAEGAFVIEVLLVDLDCFFLWNFLCLCAAGAFGGWTGLTEGDTELGADVVVEGSLDVGLESPLEGHGDCILMAIVRWVLFICCVVWSKM